MMPCIPVDPALSPKVFGWGAVGFIFVFFTCSGPFEADGTQSVRGAPSRWSSTRDPPVHLGIHRVRAQTGVQQAAHVPPFRSGAQP